jgi:hypothetical protein
MIIPGYIQLTASGDCYAVEVESDDMMLLRIHDVPLSNDTLSSALVGLNYYAGIPSQWLVEYHAARLTVLTNQGVRHFI